MQTLRIRVSKVIDFGSTVAIVGTDLTSRTEVVLHIDYRPLTCIAESWKTAGLSEQIKFEADSLTLRLDLDCDGPDDGLSQLVRKAA